MIGGGCTITPDITIGRQSFIAAGAVVTKDVPPKSFVKGVPGVITPLPEILDVPNARSMTLQTASMWDTRSVYQRESLWPEYWPERFED